MTALKTTSTKYYQEANEALSKEMADLNKFALPQIDKIAINVGVGRYEQKQKQEIRDYLEKITGQKPKVVASRLSIAGFKMRKGEEVAFAVTLRGEKIRDFLLHLIYIALPRTRDFKGIKSKSFNRDYSCYSIGVENTSIFPVVGFGSSMNFGMQINIVFKNADEKNVELLKKLNFPFKKD
jgi:large subunit ribosomal protein L5